MPGLVQSVLAGHVSNTVTSPATVGSVTLVLTQATQTGSLLVLVTSQKTTSHTAGAGEGATEVVAPNAGISWQTAVSGSWLDAGPTVGGATNIRFIGNAPALPVGTQITVTWSMAGAGTIYDAVGEFAFYEFSGCLFSNSIATLVDFQRNGVTQTNVVPTQGNVTPTTNDLILVAYNGNSSNALVGSGYTLGQVMSNATFGETQFNLNSGIALQSTAFGSGSQALCSTCAVGFKALAATAFHRNNMDDLPIWCHSYTAPEGKDKFRG